jgi:peptidoglycan/xylan/chitin deacetylase (PgdA/CDA1 family)
VETLGHVRETPGRAESLGGRGAIGRISVIALAAAGFLAAAPAPRTYAAANSSGAYGRGPLAIRHASFRQRGELALQISTYRDWGPAVLRRPSHPYICVQLFRGARAEPGRRICLQSGPARVNFGLRLVTYAVGSKGLVLSRKPFQAEIERRNGRSLSARFLASDAGVRSGRWHWRIVSAASRVSCHPPNGPQPGCADEFPAGRTLPVRVRPVHLVGCVPRGVSYRLRASAGKREVALTFDDGPGPDTAAILDVLSRHAARATFNVIGYQIAGNEKLLGRELQQGDEIGNHTWDHADVSAGGAFATSEIVKTTAAITRATGFAPCVFRAPYGAVSNGLIEIARKLRLATVGWDVDPRDWSRPGTTAIYQRVVSSVRDGSIVLMHDGGGPRDETVAALDGIIRALEARHFRLVTESELLGYRPVYRPVYGSVQ